MASITRQKNGGFQIQFVGIDKRRRSVRLGKIKPKSAELIKLRIEQLVAAQKAGVRNDPELTQWLEGIADQLHGKLARVELIPPRKAKQVIALRAFLEGYKKRRNDVKPATYEVWRQPMRNLVEFFGATRDITTITEAEALDFRQLLVGSELATTTVSKRLQFVRSFFNDARRRKLIKENPFAEVSSKSVVRLDQRHFVTKAETEKLLDSCPNHHWRTIISLARYGGLRCPSEVLSLRWQDINWDKKRIAVQSPKTEGQGKESRVIPLFPELKTVLDEAWEMAPEGAVYVVDERHRRAANRKTGWKNCNLRTTFLKIISRAGLQPWPKVFHAMRSSRETELANEYPIHVVTAWLGNTPSIALRHYLLTTADDFDRAATAQATTPEPAQESANEPTDNAVQKAVQNGAETGRNTGQGQSGTCRNTKENGRLHGIATCRGGGHGGLSSQVGLARQNATQHSIPRTKRQVPAAESSRLIPSDPVLGGHEQGQNRAKFSSRFQQPWPSKTTQWFICIIGLGLFSIAAVLSGGTNDNDDESRRRSPEERGLPKHKDLRSLARTYLETQRRLWPELAGVLFPAKITDTALDRLANLYRESFLNTEPRKFVFNGKTVWDELGAAYLRYSDKNSNPRSLDQQLKRALEKGRYENAFIPWEYVFFDAAVTGTTDERTGYQLALSAIGDSDSKFLFLFIDELGRANRNMVDALCLGRLMERHEKYLVGCSDGFDMRNPMWKTLLAIFAALQEWFVDQLREKVNRGMSDAFDEGKTLGKPGFGYTLEPTVDEFGRPVMKNDKQLNTTIIEEATRDWVGLLFLLYTERKRSPEAIGRFFNRHEVGGRNTWDGSSIRKQLANHLFAGIRVRHRVRHYKDPETGTAKTELRPRSDWQVRRQMSLRIISWDLWKRTQARLDKCKKAYSKDSNVSRTEVYPETLVRPVCGCCGYPFHLGRSGKYGAFCCGNGSKRKKKCKFKGYKSVSIVEKSILDAVLKTVVTEDSLSKLVQESNAFLIELASRPKVNTKPLKAKAKKLTASLKRLATAIADGGGESVTLLNMIKDKEDEQSLVQAELRNAEAVYTIPATLTEEDLMPYLEDLRGLLRGDVSSAAPILAKITGTITVHQEKALRSKKPKWIARFSGQLMPALLDLARPKDCPTVGTLEYLCTRSWTNEIAGEVWCRDVPNYERIAPVAMEMVAKGASIETIGRVTETSWETVKDALRFARTGDSPGKKRTGKKTRKRVGPPKYQAISDEVVRRRESGESFAKMAIALGVGESTVTRAYDFANRDKLNAAGERGETPLRGRYRHIPGHTIAKVQTLLHTGLLNPSQISDLTGVSESTVRREQKHST